ncbi:hypothetical protein QE152_g28524 [Popillia japonica]|uniref:Uncharacterized protein n=1 Tax=Popillia japonica TaxID=7064 RepID=A0AAW1JII6_POPJA
MPPGTRANSDKNQEFNSVVTFIKSAEFGDIIRNIVNNEMRNLQEQVVDLINEVTMLRQSNVELIQLLTSKEDAQIDRDDRLLARGTGEETKPKRGKKIVPGANMSAVDEPVYTAEVQDVLSTSTAEQCASNASTSSKAPKVTRGSQRKRQDNSKCSSCCINWKDYRGRADWIQCTKCQEWICSPCNKDSKDPYFICECCDDSEDELFDDNDANNDFTLNRIGIFFYQSEDSEE